VSTSAERAGAPLAPRLSVIVCSLNGAAGVDSCLRAVGRQSIRPGLEVILVDDGSTDGTGDVGRAHGATVIRHPVNRGLAAARNSGVAAAAAPVVAFLDDDCEPGPCWAEHLLAGYGEGIIGVGGPIRPADSGGWVSGYLRRNNPLRPQERDLARGTSLPYRFYLYLRRDWGRRDELARREVYSFAGANMSFRRDALIRAGGFDERFRFGGEELDLCMRLAQGSHGALLFVPDAEVVHRFVPSVRDCLRRSRAYGRGSARLYRKWPAMPPTLFPWPALIMILLLLATAVPALAGAALLAPQLLYSRGLRAAIRDRSPASLLDGYVQLAQEASGNVGFLHGLWQFRHLAPEPGGAAPAAAAEQPERRELVR
jgi:glycosyltransferase involved in cell wall biosynthesis